MRIYGIDDVETKRETLTHLLALDEEWMQRELKKIQQKLEEHKKKTNAKSHRRH